MYVAHIKTFLIDFSIPIGSREDVVKVVTAIKNKDSQVWIGGKSYSLRNCNEFLIFKIEKEDELVQAINAWSGSPMHQNRFGEFVARPTFLRNFGIDITREFLEEVGQPDEIAVEKKQEPAVVLTKQNLIFIGHGRSKLWARLQVYLSSELKLKTETFESESRVGQSIVPILEGFLDRATFAILVLTAEDEGPEGSVRARQNVIHEAGLFQGKLGFTKAILIRQNGIENFSNVDGLQYIGFEGDNIEQTFYELRRTLQREKILD